MKRQRPLLCGPVKICAGVWPRSTMPQTVLTACLPLGRKGATARGLLPSGWVLPPAPEATASYMRSLHSALTITPN